MNHPPFNLENIINRTTLNCLYRLLKAVLDNIYTTCENLMPVLEIWVFRTFEIRFSVMTKIHGKNATF